MRYVVRLSYVDVVGFIWQPGCGPCSMRYELDDYAIGNMRNDDGTITRDSVEQWLTSHSGDFSRLLDFRASIEDGDKTVEIDFATEDGENAYLDTIGDEG